MRAGPAGRVCLFRLPECVQRLWKAAGQTGGGSIINVCQKKQESENKKRKRVRELKKEIKRHGSECLPGERVLVRELERSRDL